MIELDAAAEILRTLWGDSGEIVRLPGDVDENFRVTLSDGRRSILKVVEAGADRPKVDLQAAALAHLGERFPKGSTPRVIPLSDGAATGEWNGRTVWRLEWLEGPLLAEAAPLTGGPRSGDTHRLFADLGRALAELDHALDGFEHPAVDRTHRWDPAKADWVGDALAAGELDGLLADDRRELLHRTMAGWGERVAPVLPDLPRAVLHADANEYNVVVDHLDHPGRVVAIFDFGDLLRTARVCEPAIAAAYCAGRSRDPVSAVCAVFAGYHGISPLSEAELAVAFDLVRARLAISVTISASRKGERPDDPYVMISEDRAWRVLESLDAEHPRMLTARVRHACGFEPVPGAGEVVAWLDAHRSEMHPVLPSIAGRDRHLGGVSIPLDLSIGSPMLGADPAHLETEPLGLLIEGEVADADAEVGIGRWNEPRPIYLGDLFAEGDHPTDRHRTIHIGVDLFVPAGTPIHAPLDGVVESIGDNGPGKDYGPVVLLRHAPEGCPTFWSLWGHLDPEILDRLSVGDRVAAGELLALTGGPPENGDWPPHPHVQLVTDPFDHGHDFAGVAHPSERGFWCALCPNPAALLGLADRETACELPTSKELLDRRGRTMGANLSLSYAEPIEAVRGWRQFLYDAEGRAWLDLYNNVPHVGHSDPHVARAIAEQSALFAANTRYLHARRQDYLERLLALFPDELDTAFLLPSASEANELALRLARAATGRRDLIVQEGAYHGHTTTLIDISPYKAHGPGGGGTPEWVHEVAIPDPYRGAHGRVHGVDPEEAGELFAADVATVIDVMVANGAAPGAFIAETFPSVGGQIVPPAGYLSRVYEALRAAGGLAIADEVQTGFGRLGATMWGYETQGVTPDIVVLGKPMGNGFPVAAVVTRREIADAFDNGMEFFTTFGGNPVACAAADAMLDVLEAEDLPANADERGRELLAGLRSISGGDPIVGDVRGMGLFLGVELVIDRSAWPALESGDGAPLPDPDATSYVVARLKEEGVLAGTDGPDHNVVKLRGPLVVEAADVERFLMVWAGVMAEPFLAARRG